MKSLWVSGLLARQRSNLKTSLWTPLTPPVLHASDVCRPPTHLTILNGLVQASAELGDELIILIRYAGA